MSNPNKTVAAARKRMGGFPARVRPIDPFVEWLSEQAKQGRTFKTLEEAQAEYEEGNK